VNLSILNNIVLYCHIYSYVLVFCINVASYARHSAFVALANLRYINALNNNNNNHGLLCML